jgi:hypothetical protein
MMESFISLGFSPFQTLTPAGQTPQGAYSLIFLVVFMAFIVIRRVYRGINGRAYRDSRVFMLPAIYLILTIALTVPVGLLNPDYFAVLALIPLGIIIGLRFGGNISFFRRNNQLYYKRSPFILFFWLFSFILRIILEFLFPGNTEVLIIVDALLSLTAGMILGESLHTLSKKKEFLSSPDNSQVPPPSGLQ